MRKCDKHPNCYDCPYLGTDECNPADIDCGPVIIEGKSSMDSWREVKSLSPASKAFKFIFFLTFLAFIIYSQLVCNAFVDLGNFTLYAVRLYKGSRPSLIIGLYLFIIILSSHNQTGQKKFIFTVFANKLRQLLVTLIVGMIFMAVILSSRNDLIDLYNGFDMFGAWGVDERAVFLGNSFTYWFHIMNFTLMAYTVVYILCIKHLRITLLIKAVKYLENQSSSKASVLVFIFIMLYIGIMFFVSFSASIISFDIPKWALDLIWPIFPPA